MHIPFIISEYEPAIDYTIIGFQPATKLPRNSTLIQPDIIQQLKTLASKSLYINFSIDSELADPDKLMRDPFIAWEMERNPLEPNHRVTLGNLLIDIHLTFKNTNTPIGRQLHKQCYNKYITLPQLIQYLKHNTIHNV